MSPTIRSFLDHLSQKIPGIGDRNETKTLDADIKYYSDCVYMNYYELGLSLMFVAKDASRSIKNEDISSDTLRLDSVCIYNSVISAGESRARVYSAFPLTSIVLPLLDESVNRTARELVLTSESNGRDIVTCLGEPTRKGGGTGPLSGSIGIWCEWTKDGIMIEFGGSEAKGAQAWEKGKDAKWKVLTLFASA